MDIAEYRKMSPEEKEVFLLNFLGSVKGEIHALGTRIDNVVAEMAGRIAPLEKQVKELADNVETSSTAITGLANRMDDFEERITKEKLFVATPDVGGKIKEEEEEVCWGLSSRRKTWDLCEWFMNDSWRDARSG